mmetsp:Transcript_9880/g.25441  ORF Transcript_9880/g.25441 Transcript_9880/m.25441 type:complete len:499 (+) Transcript_9880:122-1618(+)
MERRARPVGSLRRRGVCKHSLQQRLGQQALGARDVRAAAVQVPRHDLRCHGGEREAGSLVPRGDEEPRLASDGAHEGQPSRRPGPRPRPHQAAAPLGGTRLRLSLGRRRRGCQGGQKLGGPRQDGGGDLHVLGGIKAAELAGAAQQQLPGRGRSGREGDIRLAKRILVALLRPLLQSLVVLGVGHLHDAALQLRHPLRRGQDQQLPAPRRNHALPPAVLKLLRQEVTSPGARRHDHPPGRSEAPAARGQGAAYLAVLTPLERSHALLKAALKLAARLPRERPAQTEQHERRVASVQLGIGLHQHSCPLGRHAQRGLQLHQRTGLQYVRLHPGLLQAGSARRQLRSLLRAGCQQQTPGALPLRFLPGTLPVLELEPQLLAARCQLPHRRGWVSMRQPQVALPCPSCARTQLPLLLQHHDARLALRFQQRPRYAQAHYACAHNDEVGLLVERGLRGASGRRGHPPAAGRPSRNKRQRTGPPEAAAARRPCTCRCHLSSRA